MADITMSNTVLMAAYTAMCLTGVLVYWRRGWLS